jgi:hypothetical protein
MTKGKKRNPELARLMNRDAFVNSARLRREQVSFDGGAILCQEFTARDFVEYIAYFKRDDKGVPQWSDIEQVELWKFVTHLGAINPDGTKMFPDFAEMPDLQPDVLRTIGTKILHLSKVISEVADKDPNAPSSSSSPTDGTSPSEK